MNLAADLPAPRDDEPADLRRDIVDELADHLHCAVDRERQRAALDGDEAAAQNQDSIWPRVVARFGHPARIARQLWWDAMKEKIMSQRTQTATLVVMSLFCVAMMIVTFMSLADSRELARDNQALNKQLLAQLEDLAARPAPAPAPALPAANNPAEWNQLQVKCIWGSEDGEPAEGVRVFLSSNSENTSGIPSGEETTGADGIVDFGKVLYGTYIIQITLPNHLTSQEYVAVRPGQDKTVTVICPEGDGLGTVSLKPQFDWGSLPESLRGRVWVLCSIHKDTVGSQFWDTQYEYEWPTELKANGNAFESETGFDPAVDVASFLINEAGQVLAAHPLEVDGEELESAELTNSQLRRVAYRMFQLPEQPEYIDSVELPAGGYYVYSQIVVVDPADESGKRLLASEPLSLNEGSFSMQPRFGSGGPPGPMGGGYDFQSQGSPMGSGGRGGGRGWGGGREPDTTSAVQIQLGQLPYSYMVPVLSQSSMAGMYGGSRGGSSEQLQYIVRWNSEVVWDFEVNAGEQLLLADLALRVPVGTDIALIGAHILSEDEAAVAPGSVIDLVWKGLMVQPDDSVDVEEHLLLTGLNVIATGGQVDMENGVLKELYVPLTSEQAVALMDSSMQYGLVARPSSEPPQSFARTPIDAVLAERVANDFVGVSGLTVDPSTALKVIRVEAVNSGEGDGMMEHGSTCDVVATMALQSGLQRTVPLLHNRIIQRVSYYGGGVDTYEIAIIVTAEEEAVVSQFLNAEGIYTQALPATGPSVTGPFESSPHLESALLELQRWQQQSDQREEEFEQLENLRDDSQDAESEDRPLEDQGTEPIE